MSPYLAAGAIRHVRDRVASLRKSGDGWRLRTAGGETLRADLAVIATTHPAPSLPPQLEAFRDDPHLIADPLVDNVVAGIGRAERVLTATDLVAALDAQAHRGPILMISRRGLRARGQSLTSFPPEGNFLDPPAPTATALLARVRAAVAAAEAQGRGWQAVIEGVRNQGQEIWRGLDGQVRRRIVRHLRPFWDAHRFRAAPQFEAMLDRKLKEGALELRRARLGSVWRDAAGFTVELRDLSAGSSQRRRFERILVAIGPAHGAILQSQPFLIELAKAGSLALDATELGLRTSRDGHAIGADGLADPTLFVAGPLARGTFGELMGLPQVSAYAQFIAAGLAATVGRADRLSRSWA